MRLRERWAAVPSLLPYRLVIGILGGFLILVTPLGAVLAVNRASEGGRAVVLVITGAAVLGGIALLLSGARVPRWLMHLALLMETAAISLICLVSGEPDVALLLALLSNIAVLASSWRMFAVHFLVLAGCVVGIDVALGVDGAAIVFHAAILLAAMLLLASLVHAASHADRDALTGLPNRRGLDKYLDQAAARGSAGLAVVMIDIDHYRQVNDARGHQAGDEFLVRCVVAWTRAVADRRRLFRYGGDEFVLVLPQTSASDAADRADELRAVLPAGTTASAGVAVWERGDGPVTAALTRADMALYEAKANGRDRTAVFGDTARAGRRLEEAVAAGQLVLHYQPIVRLAGGSEFSREALVRWQHPERGFLMPDSFVPEAERTGAIHALGAWTLREACRAHRATDGDASVNVNVSATELRTERYAGAVAEVLAETGFEPSRLILELTEAAFDGNDPQVGETLHAVRELGVRVALDDFGSGYSSLRWLARFPVDIVKLDGVFVDRICEDGRVRALAAGILATARSLGISVVAEKVEHLEQADMLRELGCEFAQGWLYGRAEPLG